jgi:hypothetical protein
MGFLGLGEPSIGTLIIFLGAWVNRDFTTPVLGAHTTFLHDDESGLGSPLTKVEPSSPVSDPHQQNRWRRRELSLLGFKRHVYTPNTVHFQNRLQSRFLLRFPFILEIIYWALIYSLYQMGRGFLAARLSDSTIDVACRHALQVIRLEQTLHIFWELDIQHWFLQYPGVMYWINRIYSYVHLPATIAFLVGLYWFAITRNRTHATWREPISGPYLYESKRRALAVSNISI